MANTSSAKKATRKIEKRTAVNKMRRTFMRGELRKMEEAPAAGATRNCPNAASRRAACRHESRHEGHRCIEQRVPQDLPSVGPRQSALIAL